MALRLGLAFFPPLPRTRCRQRRHRILTCTSFLTRAEATSWHSLSCRIRRRWDVIPTRQSGCSTLHSKCRMRKHWRRSRHERRRKESRSWDLLITAFSNRSICFDPSGHRLELAAWMTTPEKQAKLKSVAHDMVNEWAETKKPPRHAAW